MKGSLPEADAWRSMAAEVAAGGGGNNPMKNIQAPVDFPASEKATMSQHAPRRSSLTTLRTSIGDAGQGQLRRRSGSRCSLSLSLCAVRSSRWPDFYRLWQSPSRSTIVAETTGFVGAAIAASRSISQRNHEASGERRAISQGRVALLVMWVGVERRSIEEAPPVGTDARRAGTVE
jgi:hypothetical protein